MVSCASQLELNSTLFVYGTLRQGHIYHHILKSLGAEFVSVAETVRPCSLWLNRAERVPFLLPQPGPKPVCGELYRLPESSWPDLDEFEEHPQIYQRRLLEVRSRDVQFSGPGLSGTCLTGPGFQAPYLFSSRDPCPDNPSGTVVAAGSSGALVWAWIYFLIDATAYGRITADLIESGDYASFINLRESHS